MINPVIAFGLKLIVVLAIVFGIHLFILNQLHFQLYDNLIVRAYSVNLILAFLIYLSLYLLRIKYEHLLGFIFMGGSLLKFIVFFIFFYPIYREDGEVTRIEATSFLIPYLSSLVVETYYLIRLLNNKI
jgi:hypothetical protein